MKLELKEKPTNAPVVERLNATNLTAKLERLLTNANYTTFVGLDDKKYSFTKEERELIVKRGQKFFEELEKEVVRRICQHLSTATRNLDYEANGYVSEDDALAKLDQRIIDLAKLVITAQDETNRIEGKEDKVIVLVPTFQVRPSHAPGRGQNARPVQRFLQDMGRRGQVGPQRGAQKGSRCRFGFGPLKRFQTLVALAAIAGMVSGATGNPCFAPRRSEVAWITTPARPHARADRPQQENLAHWAPAQPLGPRPIS